MFLVKIQKIIYQSDVYKMIEILSKVDSWGPLQEISATDCPYLVGMICQSSQIAERRFSRLNTKTQLVMQWPDLPFEIRQDVKLVQQCTNWLDRTLFFFIHQQLDIVDMDRKISKIINQPGF